MTPTKQHKTAELQRALTNRHIQLIAIGGAIGSFLFVGSAQVIAQTGPSALLIYLIGGITFFFGMRVLGELLLSNLNYKTFRDAVDDLWGPRAGFTIGWLYTMVWVCICVADATAVATYLDFWWPGIPTVAVAAVLLVVLAAVNLVTVQAFGELEFWFAIIKVAAIIVIAIVGLLVVITGFRFANGMAPDFTNLWAHGGFFTGGPGGFFNAFQMAFLAYGGVELVGTTAGEAKDAEKTLPKAVNALPLRISLFYVVPLALILIIAPWTYFVPGTSPFVQLFALAGVGIAASVMNFVLLTAALSGTNSGIYAGSRMFCGLGVVGEAPRGLAKLSKRSVPARSVVSQAVVCLVVAALLYFMPNAAAAYSFVASLSSPLFLIVWGMIVATYLRYCKVHPEKHAASKFKAPGGIVAGACVLAMFAFCFVLTLVFPSTLLGSLIGIGIVIVVEVAYQIHQARALS
jgi:D-serine/D-alanine/glycine transporter